MQQHQAPELSQELLNYVEQYEEPEHNDRVQDVNAETPHPAPSLSFFVFVLPLLVCRSFLTMLFQFM